MRVKEFSREAANDTGRPGILVFVVVSSVLGTLGAMGTAALIGEIELADEGPWTIQAADAAWNAFWPVNRPTTAALSTAGGMVFLFMWCFALMKTALAGSRRGVVGGCVAAAICAAAAGSIFGVLDTVSGEARRLAAVACNDVAREWVRSPAHETLAIFRSNERQGIQCQEAHLFVAMVEAGRPEVALAMLGDSRQKK
jgi:hypothetical protein